MSELVPVTFLRTGEVAEIGQLVGAPDQVRHLEELGLRTGTRLEMVRTGSPCIVRVDGSTLCFRHDENLSVLVSMRQTA